MANFPVLSRSEAPDDARPILDQAEGDFGFVPNLMGVLAHSPPALEAYATLDELLGRTSFSLEEQQVILLATSFENGCDYCMAAHSAGGTMAGLDSDVVEALRNGETLPDDRLHALARFVRAVVRERGWVDDEVDAFLEAGFERAHVLEVLLGVAMKTLSNYTNHIAGTPLDDEMSTFAWERPGRVKAGAAAD